MYTTPQFWANADNVIGTKVIQAIPMTRADYNLARGWNLPSNERGDDNGFIVRYEDGYVSWSPEKQFDDSYRYTGKMGFDHALYLLKKDSKLARAGWNGKGMFIFMVQGSTFKVNRKPLLGIYPEGTEINYHGHIDMKTVDGSIVPWLCSQTDMLADDWGVI